MILFNLIAFAVFIISLIAGVLIIRRRLTGLQEPTGMVCGGCGSPAEQVESFICNACGRDVRNCGLLVPGKQTLLSLIRRVSWFSTLLVIGAALLMAVVAPLLPYRQNGSMEASFAADSDQIEEISLQALDRGNAKEDFVRTAYADIYLSDGRVVSLESSGTPPRCRLIDANRTVVGDALPLEPKTVSQWFALAGISPDKAGPWVPALSASIDGKSGKRSLFDGFEQLSRSWLSPRESSSSGSGGDAEWAPGAVLATFSLLWVLGLSWILRSNRVGRRLPELIAP